MENVLEQVLRKRFPQFVEEELIQEILSIGKLHTSETEEVILEPGSPIRFMPLIVYGSIRIVNVNEDGREVYLYHLYPGQTCAISMNCCLQSKPSEVKSIAEETTEFIAVPVHLIDEWIVKYKSWRSFIFNSYHDRFRELIAVINDIAFHKLDDRLIKYLADQSVALKTKTLHLTHQQIASALGSSREVISRLLKTMEKEHKVVLGRNEITMKY